MTVRNNRIRNFQGSLIAFDFDGTLTTADYRSSWQAVHEYFGTWATHGKTALRRFIDGEINYTEFCIADAYPWINQSESEYQRALATIKLRDGISELLTFFKENKCILVIISQGLKDLVEKVAHKYNFNFWVANELIRKKNRITGDVEVNVDVLDKGKILQSLLGSYKIPQKKSIAIGDASADIDMFKTANISIAIEPSSKKVADCADFVCQSEDLSEIITFFDI
ncbi:phosphoserine phosphatase [Candidatus Heimdallarchaeota archaeon B3_Heim]|nr:MAG: phosphoserine phosphatase [Candidatus Heimdallarchaeota archaeon B3_Heim]